MVIEREIIDREIARAGGYVNGLIITAEEIGALRHTMVTAPSPFLQSQENLKQRAEEQCPFCGRALEYPGYNRNVGELKVSVLRACCGCRKLFENVARERFADELDAISARFTEIMNQIRRDVKKMIEDKLEEVLDSG